MNAALRTAPKHTFTVRDLVAGVSVALVAIPQGMAYAELAGLPSHHGLYAMALPLVAAAFFASSPYLQTGPVATTALLTFGALVPLAQPGSADFIALAALLAIVVGVARTLVGLMRAGWVSYLLSRPVLEGFMSGAAILILCSQLPGAFGAAAPDGGILRRAFWTLVNPGSWELASLGLSAGTVVLILGARRIHRRIPGVLIAAGAAMLFSKFVNYQGALVGQIPAGPPPLTFDLPWARLPTLVLPGIVIALVGFSEAASISRTFASESRERWDANREFISQGVANVVAGFTGGFPVGGSFARSGLNRLAGATSRWSGLVTGVAVLMFLPFAGVLAPLPSAVLSGIVIAAISSLFRPRVLLGLWSLSRHQAVVSWSTFALTLALAPHVEHAVLLGILAAGAVHLWKEMKPSVASRREGNTLYLEPEGVLWFGSVPVLDDELLRHLAQEPDVSRVVLSCARLGRIDLTAAYTLAEMLDSLSEAGVVVEVRDVPQHARRVLNAIGGAVSPDLASEREE